MQSRTRLLLAPLRLDSQRFGLDNGLGLSPRIGRLEDFFHLFQWNTTRLYDKHVDETSSQVVPNTEDDVQFPGEGEKGCRDSKSVDPNGYTVSSIHGYRPYEAHSQSK